VAGLAETVGGHPRRQLLLRPHIGVDYPHSSLRHRRQLP
jgi:hypothetical protein